MEEWPVYSEVVSPQNDLWESFVVEEHVDGRGVRHLDTSWYVDCASWLDNCLHKLIAQFDELFARKLIDWTQIDGLDTTSFPSKRSAGYKDGGQLNLWT